MNRRAFVASLPALAAVPFVPQPVAVNPFTDEDAWVLWNGRLWTGGQSQPVSRVYFSAP